MSKNYLFSDINHPFALRLAQKFSGNEDSVAGMSCEPLTENHADSVLFRNIHVFSGTPGSSLSAVSFFRKAVNDFGSVDGLLLFGLPDKKEENADEFGKLYFEILIDQKIKNMMFFLSEGMKLFREKILKEIVFIDRFDTGAESVGNVLWKSCFRAIANRMCLKNSGGKIPAEWIQQKKEKDDDAVTFTLQRLAESAKTYPSVVVSEDKKQRGLFRF